MKSTESPAKLRDVETLFPDQTTEQLLARAKAHYTPNYRQAPLVLTRGEGVWVWDRDGKRYLDFIAGIAVSALGHAHPRLVNAIRQQADALIHTSGLYHNEPAIAVMDILSEVSFADRFFFANSGAEANEAALKICRRYWTTVKERPEKTEILAFEKSFHGRTFATMTATGQEKYQKGYAPLLTGVHYAPFGDPDAVRAVLESAGGNIGTMIVEPIQCEGGLNVPKESYLRDLRKLCDEFEVLLVADEVQTGVGRTGEWFGYELSGATPDVMTLAKGLGGGVPVAAMCCSQEVSAGFVPGAHASTFGGNPLATRAALEVLRTIRDEHLLDHVYETGKMLEKGLKHLLKAHPERCVAARGYGLLRGLELSDDDPELLGRVVAAARDRGLLINGIAGKVLRMTPPLTIERGHIRFALDVLDEALAQA